MLVASLIAFGDMVTVLRSGGSRGACVYRKPYPS
jgi:hypothetical protein